MKKYDAGDLLDVSALGLESTKWLSFAINDLHKDLNQVIEVLVKRDANNEYEFQAITTKLAMVEYLADHLVDSHQQSLKTYEEEMKEGQA